MSKDALATVEPTVRSPSEGVKSFVGVLISPAIEQDLRFPRRLGLVAIFDGNEHEIRATPTQTPPKPTSRPLTRFKPSMNTVRRSNLPSPLVSSKTRMRSFPCPSGARMG